MKKKIMAIILGTILALTEVQVLQITPSAAETSDNTWQTADLMEDGLQYTQTLDINVSTWYKYIMPGKGHVDFTLSSSDGIGKFDMEIYGLQNNQITELEKVRYNTFLQSQEYAFSSGTEIYVKVKKSADGKHDREYSIQPNFIADDDYEIWETEDLNDSIALADTLNENTPTHGVIITNKDTDYYEYSRSDGKAGKVSFTLLNESSDTSARWYLTVYDQNGKALEKKYTRSNDLSITSKEYNLDSYGSIYVSVTKCIGGTAVGKEYELQTSFTETEEKIDAPAAPSLNIKSCGKNYIKISYSKPANTTKFEFNYRKQGASTWKKKTTTKTNVNLKGLKRKTTYEIRVRSIRTVDGTDYPSDWSSVKTAKTK